MSLSDCYSPVRFRFGGPSSAREVLHMIEDQADHEGRQFLVFGDRTSAHDILAEVGQRCLCKVGQRCLCIE